MEERERKDFPTFEDKTKKWVNRVYWIGIALIIITAIINVILVSIDQKAKSSEPTTQANSKEVATKKQNNNEPQKNEPQKKEEGNVKPKTLTELVVQPIAESPTFQVIFKYLFYLLLWLLLFLMLPAASQKLKRFKFFNLEFELDRAQQEVITGITVQTTKFKFLTYLMREENKEILQGRIDVDSQYKKYLLTVLEEMQSFYDKEWDQYFKYEVMTKSKFLTRRRGRNAYPEVLFKTIEAIDEYKIGIPINKENMEDIHQKNFLIYRVIERENLYTDDERETTYVIVLSSHRTFFDENDGQLLAGVSSLVSELYRRDRMSEALVLASNQLNIES